MKLATLICVLILCLTQCTDAIRVEPAAVAPVRKDGVEFRANHARMGTVEAWDFKAERKLWDVQVYKVLVEPWREGDLQFVYIKRLALDGDTLVVANEKDHVFRLDLNTHLVTSKDMPFVETIGPEAASPVNVTVQLRVVSFDRTVIDKLVKRSGLSADSLLAAWKDGKGKLLAAPMLTMPSGSEGSLRSVSECIYPTELAFPEPGPTTNAQSCLPAVPVPSTFQTREVGTIVSIWPRFRPDINAVDLTMNASYHFPPEWKVYETRSSAQHGAIVTKLEQPFFRPVTASSSISVPLGRPVLAGGGTASPDGRAFVYFIVSVDVSGSKTEAGSAPKATAMTAP
jgi:hypothetical protein